MSDLRGCLARLIRLHWDLLWICYFGFVRGWGISHTSIKRPPLPAFFLGRRFLDTHIVMISATIRHSQSVSQKTYVFIYAILFVITLVFTFFCIWRPSKILSIMIHLCIVFSHGFCFVFLKISYQILQKLLMILMLESLFSILCICYLTLLKRFQNLLNVLFSF